MKKHLSLEAFRKIDLQPSFNNEFMKKNTSKLLPEETVSYNNMNSPDSSENPSPAVLLSMEKR